MFRGCQKTASFLRKVYAEFPINSFTNFLNIACDFLYFLYNIY